MTLTILLTVTGCILLFLMILNFQSRILMKESFRFLEVKNRLLLWTVVAGGVTGGSPLEGVAEDRDAG